MFYIQFASGSKVFLVWLQETIKILISVQGCVQVGGGAFQLRFAKKSSRMLFSAMYPERNIFFYKENMIKFNQFFMKMPN